jgi:hypothetical protein
MSVEKKFCWWVNFWQKKGSQQKGEPKQQERVHTSTVHD